MKIKTNKLIDGTLNWATAKAAEQKIRWDEDEDGFTFFDNEEGGDRTWSPCTDAGQGFPILHFHRINIQYCQDLKCSGTDGLYIQADPFGGKGEAGYWHGDHTRPLVAGLRSYVRMKLGDEVEIPDDVYAKICEAMPEPQKASAARPKG